MKISKIAVYGMMGMMIASSAAIAETIVRPDGEVYVGTNPGIKTETDSQVRAVARAADKLDLDGEPKTPEEKRRARDNALETYADVEAETDPNLRR